MVFAAYALVVLGSYLLGSVPTGYLAGRARGIDIRKVGSGNIGATNVFRVLGKKAGTGVLLGDALKGWLAVKVLALAVEALFGPPRMTVETAPSLHGLELAAGVAAILGHNYTCWLRFQGGKGIATSGGVMIAWLPQPFLVVLAVWILVFAVSRYVSVASIVTAVALPLATWRLDGRVEMAVITSFLAALAIYKHRANIRRLLNGTENRFGRKKPADGGPT
ncbi:MAG TPA: acyl-phosphate glycerol 3-phosphate acyltransferase [Verrucomicrobiales bacterium]|nr:acyl-phosphate glycerol 3-phosphate acyltransferase [Verrucomicrobiales bacterium]